MNDVMNRFGFTYNAAHGRVNIKRRPNSLLQRRFHDGLNIRFHGVPPFSCRKKAYKKSAMGLHDAFSAQEKPLGLPNGSAVPW